MKSHEFNVRVKCALGNLGRPDSCPIPKMKSCTTVLCISQVKRSANCLMDLDLGNFSSPLSNQGRSDYNDRKSMVLRRLAPPTKSMPSSPGSQTMEFGRFGWTILTPNVFEIGPNITIKTIKRDGQLSASTLGGLVQQKQRVGHALNLSQPNSGVLGRRKTSSIKASSTSPLKVGKIFNVQKSTAPRQPLTNRPSNCTFDYNSEPVDFDKMPEQHIDWDDLERLLSSVETNSDLFTIDKENMPINIQLADDYPSEQFQLKSRTNDNFTDAFNSPFLSPKAESLLMETSAIRRSSVVRVHKLKSMPPNLELKVIGRSGAKSLLRQAQRKPHKLAMVLNDQANPSSTADPSDYQNFIRQIQENAPMESSDNSDDEEFLITDGMNLDDGDEDEEAQYDPNITISSKELIDLFADDYTEVGQKLGRRTHTKSPLSSIPPKQLGFTLKQAEMLQKHISSHFQLLIQSLGLANEMEGAEHVGIVIMKLILQIRSIHENFSVPNQPISVAPVAISLLSGQQQIRLPTLYVPGVQKLDILMAAMIKPNTRSQPVLRSPRHDPVLRPKPNTAQIPCRLKKHAKSATQLLSDAYYNLMTLFHEDFDPNLFLMLCTDNFVDHLEEKAPLRFLPSEDRLLLVGLKKHGLGNWEFIQSQLLPTRTARQIATRFKNMTARRAQDNPIKSFYFELMKPLSAAEQDLLYRGVQRFGKNFDRISQSYLPHRPATILRKLFMAIDETRLRHLAAEAEAEEN